VPEQQLQRSPPEKADLDDDSLIGDAKLGRRKVNHWRNKSKDSNDDHYRADNGLDHEKTIPKTISAQGFQKIIECNFAL
jgi:hypothetical protein